MKDDDIGSLIRDEDFADDTESKRNVILIGRYLYEECKILYDKFPVQDIISGLVSLLINITGKCYSKEDRIKIAGNIGLNFVKAMKDPVWDKEEENDNGS